MVTYVSVLFEEDEEAMMLEADAKYAEELQVLKALQASQISTQRPSLSSLLMQIVCKICLEKHESWQMFTNSTCSHSFCYDCTTKHATTQIQSKRKTIACPGINCTSTLDSNMLRLIIPRETLIKWDDFLCESMIPESQKLYCPFTDCSVLLINDDTSNGVTKVNCPVCRRSFCKVCRVPWHSELSCKEFGKLKGKNDDEMAVALAKMKKWKKCPNCYFFVEKAEGCVHITCRCKFEFCYTCGAKWSHSHSGCSRQNGVNIGN
ncbi:putative transcription factor C2H2 family [Helianthus annuus]|nr:putative transcription factor C2H2 family [Helianthus annuus]KAJ0718262.1 putative transcription factor C2H2 family [Helianthus annuus]